MTDTAPDAGSQDASSSRRVSRRQAIGLGVTAAGAVSLGAYGLMRGGGGARISPPDISLRAAPTVLDLGPRQASTWTYNGALPGPELRLEEGKPFRARVQNDLPEETTVHWHGIRLDNAMDGVPDVTQAAIKPGASFDYEFAPPDAGTYLYHSHVGIQLDRGLYGLLVVEARNERLRYDREASIVLDDWIDGLDGTPDDQLARLRENGMAMGPDMSAMRGGESTSGAAMDAMDASGSGAGGMGIHAASSLSAMAGALHRGRLDPGDVTYPIYLINGRPPEDPADVRVRGGERIRLRIANPAADTIFCLWVENHALTITHADGQPVEPVRTEALVVGMGERYDVTFDATEPGAHRIIAEALGKRRRAVANLRYLDAPRSAMPSPADPARMPRRIVSYDELHAPESSAARRDATETQLDLGMAQMGYEWTINGQAFADADPIRYALGQQVRFIMRNTTGMPHPMHLHGHFFNAVERTGMGARKDTILVPPMATSTVEWVADNPGRWAFHCHNAYHAEAGMMRVVEVG